MRVETLFPMIQDIVEEYEISRRTGASRAEACAQILKDNEKELADSDDGPVVWIGLAKAAGKKRELTQELLAKAEDSFRELAALYPEHGPMILQSQARICDPLLVGEEARRRPRKIFKPDWQIGDTFIYRLTGAQEKLERMSPVYRDTGRTLEN